MRKFGAKSLLAYFWLEIDTFFGFVGNTERHEKPRIVMSADRSVRKESSRSLKKMTNQDSQAEAILEQVEMVQYTAAGLREAVTATTNGTWLILKSLLILMPVLTELVSSSFEREKREVQSFHRYGPLIPQIIHCKLCFKPANARLADRCRHKCCLCCTVRSMS